jgi:hypothetical protein
MEQSQKDELIVAIGELVESDPNATPLAYETLGIMDIKTLQSIKSDLERAKNSRSYEGWFDELARTCSKD